MRGKKWHRSSSFGSFSSFTLFSGGENSEIIYYSIGLTEWKNLEGCCDCRLRTTLKGLSYNSNNGNI